MFQRIFERNLNRKDKGPGFTLKRFRLEVDLILTKKNKEKIYLEIMGAGLIHPNILKQGGF
ncbi:MAG: hypothetical protein Q8872_03155, partial [Candidatus Phytoplasma australasiaticum]|nr:hypothetical protein [Candidatus Phytoplasma australasiaticum]